MGNDDPIVWDITLGLLRHVLCPNHFGRLTHFAYKILQPVLFEL